MFFIFHCATNSDVSILMLPYLQILHGYEGSINLGELYSEFEVAGQVQMNC